MQNKLQNQFAFKHSNSRNCHTLHDPSLQVFSTANDKHYSQHYREKHRANDRNKRFPGKILSDYKIKQLLVVGS
jgi:hypothetical protein